MHWTLWLYVFLVWGYLASTVQSQTKGTLTPNHIPPFSVKVNGKQVKGGITLDANWRWSRLIPTNNRNCYNGQWDKSVCTDPISCSKKCALEGVDATQYGGSYGITTANDSVTLRYVTQGPYGRNVGSRVYVLDASKENYLGFNPIGYEIAFTADVSKLPCGLNGAVYLVEVPLNGNKGPLNTAGAAYGTGYGDAQCPKDIKYINGWTNLNNSGACAHEHDLFETNSESFAFTLHPCAKPGLVACTNAKTCGDGPARYQGVCDKDGADYNPYRMGKTNQYGPGKQYTINTLKSFEVITQFITHNGQPTGQLKEIRRLFRQSGKVIVSGSLTDESIAKTKSGWGEQNDFKRLGGMGAVEASLRRKHIFVMSLWDDTSSAQMRWLDSVYPVGSGKPSDKRGRCTPSDNRDVEYLRSRYSSASVTYSRIQVRKMTATPHVLDNSCDSQY